MSSGEYLGSCSEAVVLRSILEYLVICRVGNEVVCGSVPESEMKCRLDSCLTGYFFQRCNAAERLGNSFESIPEHVDSMQIVYCMVDKKLIKERRSDQTPSSRPIYHLLTVNYR